MSRYGWTWVIVVATALAVAIAFFPMRVPDGINPVAAFVAVFAGTVAGAARDPVSILVLAAALLGFRYPLVVALVSVLAVAVALGASWSWQQELGIPVADRLHRAAFKAAVFTLAASALAGLTWVAVTATKGEHRQ